MAVEEVRVPDIGDFADVEVIEVLVNAGDQVAVEDSLITLESDKASMEIPSPFAGAVTAINVKLGDKVSEGDLIATVDAGGAVTAPPGPAAQQPDPAPQPSAAAPEPEPAPAGSTATVEVRVPDIGDFTDVEVIELLVGPGDTVDAEDSLITLESDKASMEIPAPQGGTVQDMRVQLGDKVSEGDIILVLQASGDAPAAAAPAAEPPPVASTQPPAGPAPDTSSHEYPVPVSLDRSHSPTASIGSDSGARAAGPPAHASPAVRRFARELGAELALISGTGPKGRVLKDDVKAFVKQAMSGAAVAAVATGGSGIPPMPEIDFSKWGEVEVQPLKRIKKLSGANLHRNWLNVPHVTNHDEADVTELEAFRKSLKDEADARGVRITSLAFIMKALAGSLRQFPQFNGSLSTDGESLILKKYVHIGIAVDTKNGLVVPVFRDVDSKSIFELGAEMMDVSKRARDGKLKPDEMQGGCMSISSLGGIGGTAFTPIVNAPEVAILGVSRSRMTPVWNGTDFEPRLMLPLDLSYDHRIIDGAEAARFLAHLTRLLGDLRRLLL